MKMYKYEKHKGWFDFIELFANDKGLFLIQKH